MCIIVQFTDGLPAIAADIVSLELTASEIELNLLIQCGSITWSEKLIDLEEFMYAQEIMVANTAFHPIILL
jgi:hypothetical protein